MDWNDPVERSRLAEKLGPAGYTLAFEEHVRASTVATINGHAIRPVRTRFGRLYKVGATGRAHPDLEQAKKMAREAPPLSMEYPSE